MSRNIFAFTAHDPDQSSYPGFVSINREENGDVTVIVRSAPSVRDGIYVCGFKADLGKPGRCVPGSPECNNYCNMHPDKSLPMADCALPCRQVFEGTMSQFTVPAAEWAKLESGHEAP